MAHDPAEYGERIAPVYDEMFAGLDPTPAVERLAALAGEGPVLELGIGSGRIALPLAERGVEVRGIDASRAMVARMREKPGGEAIPVTIADFADVPVEGTYSLVFVAFNTFFALTTQEEQVGCFEAVARRLAPGGRFVAECFVPDLTRFDRGQRVDVLSVQPDHVFIETSQHDPVGQRVVTQQVRLAEDGVRFYPLRIRYAWPSELDLMARLAGLELRERWGAWDGRRFTGASPTHVSAWGR